MLITKSLPVVFTIFILLLSFGQICGQHIYFDEYGKERGYSGGGNYGLRAITQDRQGHIWFATINGLNRFDGSSFKVYKPDHTDPFSINAVEITTVLEDKHGYLWVGTTGTGLNRFDPRTEKFIAFEHNAADPSSLSGNIINRIYQDSQDRIWIATRFNGLNLWLPESKSFRHFPVTDDDGVKLTRQNILDITESADGRLWIACKTGLFTFEPEDKRFRQFHGPERGYFSNARSLVTSNDGLIWVANRSGGVSCINPKDSTIQRFTSRNGLLDDHPYTLLEDTQYKIWIGSREGLTQFDPSRGTFTYFKHDPQQSNSILPGYVTDLMEDRQGNIWTMNWNQAGLNSININEKPYKVLANLDVGDVAWINEHRLLVASPFFVWEYDLKDRTFQQSVPFHRLADFHLPDRSTINIYRLLVDVHGNYLIGTFGGGLYIVDPASQQVRHQLDGTAIYSMLTLDDGRVLIGTESRLHIYDPVSGEIHPFTGMHGLHFTANNIVYDLFQDRQSNLWISIFDQGLYQIDFQRDTIIHFERHKDKNSISSNTVWSILQDQDGTMWIATAAGLDQFDAETGQFIYQKEINQLEESFRVSALLQDDSGKLWMTSPNYIYQFDPTTKAVRTLSQKDGITFGEGTAPFLLKDNNGHLFFGSDAGFWQLSLDAPRNEPEILSLNITDLQLFNQSVNIGQYDSLLRQTIASTDHIQLKHDQNYLSFSYHALSFIKNDQINYSYRLKGFEENWQEVGKRKEATYTHLDPGIYTFQVRARYGKYGPWSSTMADLQITITPPWWNTTTAWGLWFILFAILAYGIYRALLNRHLERTEAMRLKEMDTFKTRLYTGITHEFRTPLTVILGIADHLREQWSTLSSGRAQQQLAMIDRNGKNLLKLVNQMLDLSRIEAEKMEVKWVSGEIIAYLSYLLEAMESLADSKNIRLEQQFELTQLQMDYDSDKLQVVLTNLLTNAIKFTPTGGKVVLRASLLPDQGRNSNLLQLAVSDNGIGISAEDQESIFQPFFQVDPASDHLGTGIGLSLSRGLVELMGGTLSVTSEPGQGSTFTIQLPIRRQAAAKVSEPPTRMPAVKTISRQEVALEPENDPNTESPLLLLIEDNLDLVRYLQECLQDNYRLIVAGDGEQGIQLALDSIPDAIISDVMMPKKDGLAVCKELKHNEKTSHIPIILLTAKATMEDRISGLDRGADAYITKPFHKKELLIRLQQLIQLRESLKKRYTGNVALAASRDNALEQIEDAFITKVNKIILEHLDDTGFDSAKLCQALAISNTQLYRKLKTLTGESIAVYIRSVRLHQAKQLLVESDLKISEIAYRVGFKDLSYFSRCFVKKFEQSPQKFRKDLDTVSR